jgi:putative NADPH-quinone reductase
MARVLVIFAHPRFQHSRVNRALLEQAHTIDGVVVHDLYEAYPDFHVNIAHEQQMLEEANLVVVQHPLQWYSAPSLLKKWLDVVLQDGWAYGEGGTALHGKTWWQVVSAGGARESYCPKGDNSHSIDDFLLPFRQTARHCGMLWRPPLVFYDAHQADDTDIHEHAAWYGRQVREAIDNG